MRSQQEIYGQIDAASDAVFGESGGNFGMTYEEGVYYALRWVIGEEESAPMSEE